MIIDTLANASIYFSVHPLFEKAFKYIQSIDMGTVEMGKHPIEEDNLRAIFSTSKGMTREASTAEFECHNKYIDIQLCINGTEQFGWKPRQNCTMPNGGYDAEKDVQFYHDAPDMFFQLMAGQFVILFPEDVHAPMISDGEIKKLVIKVKV